MSCMREVLTCSFIAVVAGQLSAGVGAAEGKEGDRLCRPNIIFMLADDMGRMIWFYGQQRITLIRPPAPRGHGSRSATPGATVALRHGAC
jgi:hypothetical protein